MGAAVYDVNKTVRGAIKTNAKAKRAAYNKAVEAAKNAKKPKLRLKKAKSQ
jgi:hypothetical protein